MPQIVIKGAREHNLKGIDLELPRGKLIVFVGVSGSGKSSLAFDTIYAEGRRRYLESLSLYARQFLGVMNRPDLDSIEGLSPTVAIRQGGGLSRNPRSTVATATGLYDYLRLLFTHIGEPFCPRCGRSIRAYTKEEMVDEILRLPEGERVYLLSPIKKGTKRAISRLLRDGFTKALVGGEVVELSSLTGKEGFDLLVDRLILKEGVGRRARESLELALRYGEGIVKVRLGDGQERVMSQTPYCIRCELSFPSLTPSLFSFNHPDGMCPRCKGTGLLLKERKGPSFPTGARVCDECGGKRLRKEALNVRIEGLSIADICALSIKEALGFFGQMQVPVQGKVIADLLEEIRKRLSMLVDVEVGYLSLDRPTNTLSAGETQRVRIAAQIGSGLSGMIYVLDEPSHGLHPREYSRLLRAMRALRDMGNTVIVVEHDQETILAADWVVELGPGAGPEGGEVIFSGPPRGLLKEERSPTARYLLPKPSPLPRRRPLSKGRIRLAGAREHNLKGITVEFPLGVLCCVTGVSGSGKSTLVMDTLYRALAQRLRRSSIPPGQFEEIEGWEEVDRVIALEQAPIFRTPRSNPATFTGVFSHIRGLFARLPEARVRGWGPSRFSFNAKEGRCEVCQGEGMVKVEMALLPDTYVVCERCGGKRFQEEVLEVKYRGESIADVLDMTVEEALHFFRHIPPIKDKLEVLKEVGLGYLKLGQPFHTLSGGEIQRLRLSRELARQKGDRTLYILDEPTAGLHPSEIERLIEILGRLIERGGSVIVVEHNLDVLKAADYIIDLGPEGGEGGGEVVASGRPEEVASNPRSHTGRFLKRVLEG